MPKKLTIGLNGEKIYEDLDADDLAQKETDKANSALKNVKDKKKIDRTKAFDNDPSVQEMKRKIKSFDNPGKLVAWVNSKVKVNSPHFERDVRDFLVDLVKVIAEDKMDKRDR